MAKYPETPVPQFPAEIRELWKTIVTPFDGGAEQRRQKQAFPKYDIDFVYAALRASEIAVLWNFYRSMRGSHGAFYCYFPEVSASFWAGLPVGIGDGIMTIFDLPGRNTSSQIIYNNGSVVDPGDRTILIGGGAEGSDRVEFALAPAENAILTCDFAGFFRNRCRFEDDSMSRHWFQYALFRTGIKLKGLNLI